MDVSVILDNLPFLLEGFKTTLELTVLTLCGGLFFGAPLAFARSAQAALPRYFSLAIIETIRGTPILMLIFWIYFLLPRLVGVAVPAYAAGLIALIVFNTAYSAEIVRAGIQSVELSNIDAARAGGLSWFQTARYIIMPQVLSNMTPALLSQGVMVYKTTSLIYVIGVVDFFRAATIIDNREFKSVEIFTFVALVYFIPCAVISRISRKAEMKRAYGFQVGRGV